MRRISTITLGLLALTSLSLCVARVGGREGPHTFHWAGLEKMEIEGHVVPGAGVPLDIQVCVY